jgi:hypothetical protein
VPIVGFRYLSKRDKKGGRFIHKKNSLSGRVNILASQLQSLRENREACSFLTVNSIRISENYRFFITQARHEFDSLPLQDSQLGWHSSQKFSRPKYPKIERKLIPRGHTCMQVPFLNKYCPEKQEVH